MTQSPDQPGWRARWHDIIFLTNIGWGVAALIMVLGYSIIAVPTGIVSVEMREEQRRHARSRSQISCPGCGARGHDADASHCKHYGAALPPHT